MTDLIPDLLREAISQRYGGNMTRLAEVLDVPVQSVSKWVAEDERKLKSCANTCIWPTPRSLKGRVALRLRPRG